MDATPLLYTQTHMWKAVADPEFYNGGGRLRGGVWPQKIEFLPEKGGFWCILGLLFTFMQKKLVRSMGGSRPRLTLNPPLVESVNMFTVFSR